MATIRTAAYECALLVIRSRHVHTRVIIEERIGLEEHVDMLNRHAINKLLAIRNDVAKKTRTQANLQVWEYA